MPEEIGFANGRISNFEGSWPGPWIGSYCTLLWITHTCQISLKTKKLFVDGRTYRRLRPVLLNTEYTKKTKNMHRDWKTALQDCFATKKTLKIKNQLKGCSWYTLCPKVYDSIVVFNTTDIVRFIFARYSNYTNKKYVVWNMVSAP